MMITNRKFLMSLLTIFMVGSSLLFASPSYHSYVKRYKAVDGEVVNKWQIQFKVASAVLDSTIANNLQTLRDIKAKINELNSKGDRYLILGIKIRGYASPEGPVKFNKLLSQRRAESIKQYFMKAFGFSEDRFDVQGCGEYWDELKLMIEKSGHDWAPAVLNLLDNVPSNQDPEMVLRKYKGGRYFKYMLKWYFPILRSASTVQLIRLVPTVKSNPVDTVLKIQPQPIDTVVNQPIDTVVPITKKCNCMPPTIGLRTNALYWALLMPNVGVEFYLGNRYSLLCDVVYKWKTFIARHHRYNVSSITGEFRYWFKKHREFTGWYLGLYGRYGEFDVKFSHTGRQGYFGGGGLSSGYVFSFHKAKCLFFELGASAGFDHLTYDRYYWYDPYNIFDGHVVKNSFSLTRLNASFIWRF